MPRSDVALIAPYPEIGVLHGGSSGVASYSANLARSLAQEGARVEVIAPALDGRTGVRERDGAVLVRRAFARGSAGTVSAMRAAMNCDAPVVHLQHEFFLYGGAGSSAGLAAGLGALRARDRGTVVTMHQVVDSHDVDRAFTRLHRVRVPAWAARGGLAGMQSAIRLGADRTIVHEPAFAEVIPGAEVVPHGVQPASVLERDGARRKLGVPAGEFSVLCFGFLAPYKGLEVALQAGRDAGGSIRLTVAGGEHPRLMSDGDPYAAQLRERDGGRARFTGRVADDDVAAWFAATDLALFMYPRPFSSSGALALALAHGTPLLASPELTRTAGLPPACGVARDAAALTARLRELAADAGALDDLRTLTAGVARTRDWATVARRHLALYSEIGDAGRARRG